MHDFVVHRVRRGATARDLTEFLSRLQSNIDLDPELHRETSQNRVRSYGLLSPSWAPSLVPDPPAPATDPWPKRSYPPDHSSPDELSRSIGTTTSRSPRTSDESRLLLRRDRFARASSSSAWPRPSLSERTMPRPCVQLFDLAPRAWHHGDKPTLAAIDVQEHFAHAEFRVGHIQEVRAAKDSAQHRQFSQ